MILFACGNVASLRLQLILARHLSARLRIGFMIWSDESGLEPYRREIGSLGPCIALGSPPPAKRPTAPGDKGKVLQFRDYHRAAIDQAKQKLEQLRATAIVVSEDGISADMHFMRAAKELGIRVVDVPYGFNIKADFDTDLEMKKKRGELVEPSGQLADELRGKGRHWFKTGAFAGATMFRPEFILGALAAGIDLPDPWFVHGGVADVLCAEGPRARDRYVAEGVPPGKVVLTGSPYGDRMVAAASREPAAAAAIRQPRRIEAGRTRFLVSWGPSYHGLRGDLSEFPSYEEMTSSFLGRLRRLPDAAVTVSLHPACSAETADLVRSIGYEPSPEYVIDLIPRHDVFVTFFSSTIRWALACGKPVLNYNAYGWKLDSFDSVGLFTSGHADEIGAKALEFTSSEGFGEFAARQCAVAEEWGPLDGKCCERIAELLPQS